MLLKQVNKVKDIMTLSTNEDVRLSHFFLCFCKNYNCLALVFVVYDWTSSGYLLAIKSGFLPISDGSIFFIMLQANNIYTIINYFLAIWFDFWKFSLSVYFVRAQIVYVSFSYFSIIPLSIFTVNVVSRSLRLLLLLLRYELYYNSYCLSIINKLFSLS